MAIYTQVLPCPYCGVTEDRNHDLKKHLVQGTPEADVQAYAKEHGVSTAKAALTLLLKRTG